MKYATHHCGTTVLKDICFDPYTESKLHSEVRMRQYCVWVA